MRVWRKYKEGIFVSCVGPWSAVAQFSEVHDELGGNSKKSNTNREPNAETEARTEQARVDGDNFEVTGGERPHRTKSAKPPYTTETSSGTSSR